MIWRVLFFLCLPMVALAQEAGVEAPPQWQTLVTGGLIALVPAILSAFLPSQVSGVGGFIMKVIDILAMNWGKARNAE